MSKAFYVTTPIYYPNAEPHTGHAYTTIIADIIARWKRLEGYDVFFLTGTDEHGLKLQRAALERGLQPKEFVDMMVEKFKEAWKALRIEYSRFIRTTDADHEELVKNLLMELWKKGLIVKGKYAGWYCTSCEKFFSEGEYVEEEGRKLCPIHMKELEWVEEETYFLKLSKFQDYVLKVLSETDVVYPKEYVREVVSKLRLEGLKDLSITRPKSRVFWGIEAPWDRNHTIYVWIDALLNYLTGIKLLKDKEFFSKYWSEAHHIIGKDILWFHTIIWFALLKMIGIPPPKKVVVHGFVLMGGKKMGKSTGNVVTIDELLKDFDADVVRYCLMRVMSLDKDIEFTFENMVDMHNNELADILGNLVRRLGVLSKKKLGGVVSKDSIDEELRREAERTIEAVRESMNKFRFSEALVKIFDLFRYLNAYLNKTEPWKKEKPNYELYNAIEGLRFGVTLLWSFMPYTCEKIAKVFDFKIETIDKLVFGKSEKFVVTEVPLLFKKIKKKK
ncbi:MAG: methionine--tRNA ligase [Thermoprotei archaeon]|nr:MAG: methionine--tRNA ligase [Thermoprotei archaeon]